MIASSRYVFTFVINISPFHASSSHREEVSKFKFPYMDIFSLYYFLTLYGPLTHPNLPCRGTVIEVASVPGDTPEIVRYTSKQDPAPIDPSVNYHTTVNSRNQVLEVVNGDNSNSHQTANFFINCNVEYLLTTRFKNQTSLVDSRGRRN